MQIIADFHIHSYLSHATSKSMNIEEISKNGKLKGLNLIGSGDFTNPVWFTQIKEKFATNETENGSGIFEFGSVNWILTCEVSTIYTQDNKTRKVHHVIHAPSIEVVEQINEALQKYGNLQTDGRPMLTGLSSPELVEILMEISDKILIYPAHAWTPFFGCFGSKTGFDNIKDCYQDQTKHIFALETGLSSDPAMNWRLSDLDDFTLISNSDAHSPWPWRLGREFNVFELKELTYWKIVDVIKRKDKSRFLFTGEVPPEYGKYHWDGHRKCGISFHPKDALKLNNICPRCGRKLTIGVLHRVEELADRAEGFVPKNAIPFKTLLPLYEIISFVTGVNQLYSRKVVEEQDRLIKRFGNEFNILLNVPKEELLKATSGKITDAIIKIRNGQVRYIPGYDGIYGTPVFSDEEYERLKKKQIAKAKEQRSLKDFK